MRKNIWGQDEMVDRWTYDYLNYNNKFEYYYYTNWELKVDWFVLKYFWSHLNGCLSIEYCLFKEAVSVNPRDFHN